MKRCPSFAFLVFKYSSACLLGVTSQGTRSTTSDRRVRDCTLSGLLESKRTRDHSEGLENFAGECEIAVVGFETEALIGFHGVETGVL